MSGARSKLTVHSRLEPGGRVYSVTERRWAYNTRRITVEPNGEMTIEEVNGGYADERIGREVRRLRHALRLRGEGKDFGD